MNVFEMVERDSTKVVLKVKDSLTNLDIALNPYINKQMDYITITRGKSHILTIIYKDGHTFSFSWGDGGYTLVSDNLTELRCQCVSFIENECHILLEHNDKSFGKSKIFYNSTFNKWELVIEKTTGGDAIFFSKNAKTLEDMFEETKKILGNIEYSKNKKYNLNHRIAITGISVWDLVEE